MVDDSVYHLAAQGALLNPDYFLTLFADQDDSGVEIGTIVNIVAAFVIGGIAVWDIVDGFLKARRFRRAVRAA